MIDLLADPGRARELGRRGRRFVATAFDPAREADELAALYRRILAEPEPSALPLRTAR